MLNAANGRFPPILVICVPIRRTPSRKSNFSRRLAFSDLARLPPIIFTDRRPFLPIVPKFAARVWIN